MGSTQLKRECGASLSALELTRENKFDMGEILQPKHCGNRKFSKSEIHVCRFGGGPKSSIFNRLGKHWLGSTYLKRECGAYLNARELTREEKVDMGENLSPRVKYMCVDLGEG